MTDEAPKPPLPSGDYSIVEFFGHTQMIGRITEVEQFGVKMLAIQPLFRDELLSVVFAGGASIYRMTPCSPEVARKHQAVHLYELPPSVKAVVPQALIPSRTIYEADLEDPDFDEVPGG